MSQINTYFDLIRALGVSFYQICTGYLPFVANKTVISSNPTPDLPDEFYEYNILFKKYLVLLKGLIGQFKLNSF
jgi:hypothetical protein